MTVKPKDLSKASLNLNSNLRLFQIYKNLKNVTFFRSPEVACGRGNHTNVPTLIWENKSF